MKRARVLHLVVAGDIGGAERLLVDLAKRPDLTDADHQIALFTPNPALGTFLATTGVRVFDRGLAHENPLAFLARSLGPNDTRWLADLLTDERVDVLHTHTFGTHVLGTRAARRAGKPQLRTEHHVMHYFDRSTSPFTRWAAARTDRFVAVSDYVQRVLETKLPAIGARCTVVRNGIDTAYFSPRPRDGGPFRVAIVCRLTAWKRVHLAVEAAALAGVPLVVVGDGEERGRLEALARARKADVRFVGHQADPRPHLAECDAGISAAKDEPLGLSVLESLAMGRPVIAVAGGGISEIVRDGETGLLVRDPTPAALAEAFARLAADRDGAQRMGEAARRFVVDACGIERMCEGYRAVYRELVRPS
jgi:glycosyltransferase involved in cell wall biosynthesis